MKEKISRLWPSALVPLLFFLCTVIQFWPALTGAASISKVQQLAEWDSLFAAQKSGQSMLMDPSLVYLMVPSYLLKASLLHAGQLPLWNPYSGLGCPLAADPQSLSFSPLHLPLILNPGLTAYNQVLVLEIMVLGLSTYFLARSLGLGLFASAFTMVAIAFCPFQRWYLELLGNGYCLVPLAFWVILGLRKKLTAARCWLTGLGCAVMVLSAHPELSFFTISLASLALLLYVAFDRAPGSQPENSSQAGSDSTWHKSRLCRTFLALTGAGVVAFMLSAPMLVPFLEYLKNSDSYKFGSGAPAIVPWQAFIFNLLQPGYGGASPTLGPCAAILLPLAFAAVKSQNTMVKVLFGLSIFCVLLTGKVFPLNLVLSHAPLSYLVVTYAFPSLVLITALLSGYGLDAALRMAKGGKTAAQEEETRSPEGQATPADEQATPPDEKAMPQDEQAMPPDEKAMPQDEQAMPKSHLSIAKPLMATSLAIALLVVLFPLVAKGLHVDLRSANFDMCMPDYAFSHSDVLRYSILALLTGAVLLAAKLKPGRAATICLVVAIGLGQLAEIATSAKSLPKRAAFKYQETAVVPQMQTATHNGNQRFIATGNHLFRANSNVVFGLSDLREHNPIFPKRYPAFLKACGAHLDEFNQEFESPLSPLLDAASVKLVLSQTPVLSQKELETVSQKSASHIAVEILPQVGIWFNPVMLDKEKQAFFSLISFYTAGQNVDQLSYNLAVYDASGKVLWFSDPRPLKPDLKITRLVSLPLSGAQSGKKFQIGLQVFDNKANHWLSLPRAQNQNKTIKDAFWLCTAQVTENRALANPDYKQLSDSQLSLKLYENLKATPRAYVVHEMQEAKNAEASLEAIQARTFDPRKSVVIESTESGSAKEALLPAKQGQATSSEIGEQNVALVETAANRVSIDAELKAAGILVLTDMNYPGWQAKLDGQSVPIMRADYLMRAVAVPAGKHRVTFSYFPFSFALGLGLFNAALLGGMLVAITAAITSRRSGKRE